MNMNGTQIPPVAAFHRDPDIDGATRRERGRVHFTALVVFWLGRNGWSHPSLAELAAWALNEDGAIHTSQVSHLRQGRARLLGTKALDALGMINVAVWAYQNDRKLFNRMGTRAVTVKIEELIKNATVITNPLTGHPMGAGDLQEVYLGLLQVPDVLGGDMGSSDLEGLAERVGPHASRLIIAAGLDFVSVRERIATCFDDEQQARRLLLAAAGLGSYDPGHLVRDASAICCALERLDGRPRTPATLATELAASR